MLTVVLSLETITNSQSPRIKRHDPTPKKTRYRLKLVGSTWFLFIFIVVFILAPYDPFVDWIQKTPTAAVAVTAADYVTASTTHLNIKWGRWRLVGQVVGNIPAPSYRKFWKRDRKIKLKMKTSTRNGRVHQLASVTPYTSLWWSNERCIALRFREINTIEFWRVFFRKNDPISCDTVVEPPPPVSRLLPENDGLEPNAQVRFPSFSFVLIRSDPLAERLSECLPLSR